MKRTATIAIPVVGLALLLAAWAGSVHLRPVPWDERWRDEIHPLLGAAPPGSFARRPNADPWLDFRGKSFARARTKPRLLLVGARDAVELLPRLEAAVPHAEVVLAARPGYGVAQEAILVGRFAPLLDVTGVVAFGRDDSFEACRPLGWTREWEAERAAQRAPLLELASAHVGLVPRSFVEPRIVADPEVRGPCVERGRALVEALARARGLAFFHGSVADADALLRRIADATR